MKRGRLLTAMARQKPVLKDEIERSVVHTYFLPNKEACLEKKSLESLASEEESIWEQLPYETATSHDVGMIEYILLKLQSKDHKVVKSNVRETDSESEEDVFHETDFDDSDFIPSRRISESELNSSSDSIRAMGAILEANLNNFESRK